MLIDTDDIGKVSRNVKKYNARLNILMHAIEDCRVDAVGLVKIASAIKDCRIKRRKWKNLEYVCNGLGSGAEKLGKLGSANAKFMEANRELSKDSLIRFNSGRVDLETKDPVSVRVVGVIDLSK